MTPATARTPTRRPTLAVFKLASCDGCQLTLLNCEDELLAIAGAIEIAHFTEATSADAPGPYDLGIVEGSVTTDEDVERIRHVRSSCRYLVAIGACATAGGIQALRNTLDLDGLVSSVYPRPDYIRTLATSTPVSAHVRVDLELHGCPIDRRQLLEVVTAFVQGRAPRIATESVCAECKRRGTVCVVVAHGTPCLGPVTNAGCGALCPAYTRGCYGCFGPLAGGNTGSVSARLVRDGVPPRTVARMFRTFNVAAAANRAAADLLDPGAGGDRA